MPSVNAVPIRSGLNPAAAALVELWRIIHRATPPSTRTLDIRSTPIRRKAGCAALILERTGGAVVRSTCAAYSITTASCWCPPRADKSESSRRILSR